jgi:hypothetical protein
MVMFHSYASLPHGIGETNIKLVLVIIHQIGD